MADRNWYARHGPISDPGSATLIVQALPADVAVLRDAARQLVFHYRADGDLAANGVDPARMSEIDLRYADAMFRRAQEVSGRPLGAPRPPAERVVGCCRDFTLFMVSMARVHGVPARARVGFASYFRAGWHLDHVVAQVWDAGEHRWRLIDPELDSPHVDANDGVVVDPLDVSPDRFVVAGRAWARCRDGAADPETYVVDPDLAVPETRGWPQIAHNVLQDLAALNKVEMILWDSWGFSDGSVVLSPGVTARVDEVAALTADDGRAVDDLTAAFEVADVRVPQTVDSVNPTTGEPRRVTLRT
jgi:hypothetical protein